MLENDCEHCVKKRNYLKVKSKSGQDCSVKHFPRKTAIPFRLSKLLKNSRGLLKFPCTNCCTTEKPPETPNLPEKKDCGRNCLGQLRERRLNAQEVPTILGRTDEANQQLLLYMALKMAKKRVPDGSLFGITPGAITSTPPCFSAGRPVTVHPCYRPPACAIACRDLFYQPVRDIVMLGFAKRLRSAPAIAD